MKNCVYMKIAKTVDYKIVCRRATTTRVSKANVFWILKLLLHNVICSTEGVFIRSNFQQVARNLV